MTKQFTFDIEDLAARLKTQLELPLPGMQAQLKTEPITRQNFREKYIHQHAPRLSAVLILLFEEKGQIKTVFIERAVYDGVHSGQIAFPGGRHEESDESLIFTALRETNEEIGIPMSTLKVIGQLSNLFIPPSNFDVLPVVGYTTEYPIFKPDPAEVNKIIPVELTHLLNGDNCRNEQILLRNNTQITAPCYVYEDLKIWGATSMILSEFLEVLRAAI